jgi:hypothetical protein
LGYEHVDELLGRDMHSLLHHHRGDGTFFLVEECRILRATRTGEGSPRTRRIAMAGKWNEFPR